MDSAALELDAVKFAKTAVTHDQTGKYNEAVFYYKVSGFGGTGVRQLLPVNVSSRDRQVNRLICRRYVSIKPQEHS